MRQVSSSGPRQMHLTLAFVLRATVLTMGVFGCGGGISEETLQRAHSEYELGLGLMEERNFAGAFQHLNEAVRLDPDNAEAHLVLGNLYLFRRDHARAERHLLEALRANRFLEAAGRPALDSEANNSLGVLYIHTRRYDRSIAVLREASVDLMNRTPHLAWGNLGWAQYEQGDYAGAIDSLTQAVQIQPNFCAAWYRIGQTYFARARTQSSEPSAVNGVAPATQDLNSAEIALTRALSVDADACRSLQEAWLLRGETRARLGRREDAIVDLERCVELGTDSEPGRACSNLLSERP